ncbi:hypothetical protein WR25_08546 [Diploscapter pachys]|uniref:Alpha-D-phosphohexomutase alpha/beta/alpha domain-containing protein n=1 Tax=Diploscapter pachys TaxID=2018661 RepID=A0A2A2M532_9BILA|nr:hypothetical protein WR25_08546 [Diploscapter pachys]
MVDHTGTIVDGDELLFIIGRDMQERGKLQGGVVGTLMSNLGLELAFKELDIPCSNANGCWVAKIPGMSSAAATPPREMRSSPRCKC